MTQMLQLRLGPHHHAFLEAAAAENEISMALVMRLLIERKMRDVAELLGIDDESIDVAIDLGDAGELQPDFWPAIGRAMWSQADEDAAA